MLRRGVTASALLAAVGLVLLALTFKPVVENDGVGYFVYLHSVWFGLWILLNVGLVGGAVVFDKFPFGLLTMIVSLEAIFLSTFVMVSQNRQAARADIRSQLDFETNLRAEIWSVADHQQPRGH